MPERLRRLGLTVGRHSVPDGRLLKITMRISRVDIVDRFRLRLLHLREFVRCTTPRRVTNLALLHVQRLLRRERVVGMPAKYVVDPINICNLRCPLCPTGRGILARPPRRMALVDFTRIVDEVAPYAYQMQLCNWGEPLLHPDIAQMIEYASQRRISVELSSNLNHLNAELARRLVLSGLGQLIVSIDGSTQGSYAAYRRQGQLQKVLDNLTLLIETRKSLGRHTPFILWRMLVGKHNEHEVEAVRSLARQLGVDSFTTGVLYVDTLDSGQVEDWVPSNPAYSAYPPDVARLENSWHCRDLWEVMVINPDGGVCACCWLHDPQYDFGNATGRTLREIWNGPAYLSARRVIGKARKGAEDVSTICDLCRGHPHYMSY